MTGFNTLSAATLETALNRILALDPESQARLARLDGKVIALDIQGLNLSLFLLPGPDGVLVQSDYGGQIHVTLRGTPLGLARLSREGRAGPGTQLVGDTQVGREFNDLITGLDIDWEEQLSRLVGDATAHQTGRLLRGLTAWGRSSLTTLSHNLGEYLTREARDLPPRRALEGFLDEVDRLRDDVERLEVRIERLRRRLEPDS
ncbi:MAG: SCP2 sterol-binding domain-containing protein [Candidatus Competibacteraceae bacterium]|nr:SCP2 sterol-binding domain-containing protein [Candidatus Competibacteraceae bacterium]